MGDQSEDFTMLTSRNKFTVAVEGGLMLVINLVALMGNLLICLVMYNKPRFHTTTNTFTLVLAVCYGFIACLVMPFTVGSLVTGRWLFGQVLCDIQGFSSLALTWISLLTLTLMAITQFFQATRLAFYNKWFSLNRSYGMILAIWIVVITVLICPIASGAPKFQFSPGESLCAMSFSEKTQTRNTIYVVVTLALYVTLPVVSLISRCAIRRHNAYVHTSGQNQRKSEIEMKISTEEGKTNHTSGQIPRISVIEMRMRVEDQKTNRVLLTLILVVLLFWLPAVLIKILALPISLPRQVHLSSTFFWFVVPALYPIIYGVLHRPFSREVLRVLPISRKRQNKVNVEDAI